MNVRTISLIALCAGLAACNSKPAEPTAMPTENVSEVIENQTEVAAPAEVMKAAPEGLPSRVAREVLQAGGHKCDGVTDADRNAQDGSIVANCTGGESYRIYTVEGKGPVATKI